MFAARAGPKLAITVALTLPLPVFVAVGTKIHDTDSDAVQVQYGGAVTLMLYTPPLPSAKMEAGRTFQFATLQNLDRIPAMSPADSDVAAPTATPSGGSTLSDRVFFAGGSTLSVENP